MFNKQTDVTDAAADTVADTCYSMCIVLLFVNQPTQQGSANTDLVLINIKQGFQFKMKPKKRNHK